MDLSVVVPVYFNEETVVETYERTRGDLAARFPDLAAEFVFVDDGSGDGSLARLLDLCRRAPDVTVVKLARNFGQPRASLAGFAHARGRFAARIAADLQEPATLVGDLYAAAVASGAQAAIAEREARDEGPWRRWTSRLSYSLLRATAFRGMPTGGFDCMLLETPLYRDLERDAPPVFLQGALLSRVPDPARVRYRRAARGAGRSRWTLRKKVGFLWDGLSRYTRVPQAILAASGILLTGSLVAVARGGASWIAWTAGAAASAAGAATLAVLARRRRERRRGGPLWVVEKVVRGAGRGARNRAELRASRSSCGETS